MQENISYITPLHTHQPNWLMQKDSQGENRHRQPEVRLPLMAVGEAYVFTSVLTFSSAQAVGLLVNSDTSREVNGHVAL